MTEKYIDETIVILGQTLTDATSEYRRLFAQEPHRVMGRTVKIVSTQLSPVKLGGLRIHDWSESPSAARGRHYAATIDTIQCSIVHSGGAATT